MGDGTSENPYNRTDILKKIVENEGKAEGLDLSGSSLIEGIDLSGLDLKGIILKNISCLSVDPVKAMFDVYTEEIPINEIVKKGGMKLGVNFQGSRMSYAQLNGANLRFSNFHKSELARTNLSDAKLEFSIFNKALLVDANLRGAHLTGTYLEGASLEMAHLEGAHLGSAKFSNETKMATIDWGNFIIGEEKTHSYRLAEETYRHLKKWYTDNGMYDIAGEFFFREMTARRYNYWFNDSFKRLVDEMIGSINVSDNIEEEIKDFTETVESIEKFRKMPTLLLQFVIRPKHPFKWLWSKIISILCGYGERPARVISSGVMTILLFTLVFFLVNQSFNWPGFWHSIYFSFVSFTAIGYGGWVDKNWINIENNWILGLGVVETILGVFMMALFLVTFTRKMTR